ncbi:MAG: helix-turn-helix domain-containing protein [Candidatus Omnitrophica bacterium]|nr:helix-turn-helix domain-containing protein [Candidatus Omnitrophota bacterium]
MSDQEHFFDLFSSEVNEIKSDPDYVLEGVILDLTEQILEEMDKKGITRRDLAQKMGKSSSCISRALRGNQNLTLSTAVQIGLALGLKMNVSFSPMSKNAEEKAQDSAQESIIWTLAR